MKVISTEKAPGAIGPYSQGMVCGNMVFTSGQIPIIPETGEIAEDLTYYFATSEQTPSSVGLGVLMTPDNTVDVAGGFIVQLMPNTSEETIDRLEQNIQSLEPVTAMLKSGMTPEDMLAKVLDGFELTVTDKREVGFVCDCSTQRVERSLAAISSDDLDEIIAKVFTEYSKQYQNGTL